MTKKNAAISKSADGKIWVMPGGKPKVAKKRSGKKGKAATKTLMEKKAGRAPALAPFMARLPIINGKVCNTLTVTFKGTKHNATILEDGRIQVEDVSYNSPSRAGKAIAGREVDGWTFWSYEKEDGSLEKIDVLRKRTA